MTDLNTLIPSDSGWRLDVAYAINNEGQIVGQGSNGSVEEGFLLTPTTGAASSLAVAAPANTTGADTTSLVAPSNAASPGTDTGIIIGPVAPSNAASPGTDTGIIVPQGPFDLIQAQRKRGSHPTLA
jgi:hypothetical protein